MTPATILRGVGVGLGQRVADRVLGAPPAAAPTPVVHDEVEDQVRAERRAREAERVRRVRPVLAAVGLVGGGVWGYLLGRRFLPRGASPVPAPRPVECGPGTALDVYRGVCLPVRDGGLGGGLDGVPRGRSPRAGRRPAAVCPLQPAIAPFRLFGVT